MVRCKQRLGQGVLLPHRGLNRRIAGQARDISMHLLQAHLAGEEAAAQGLERGHHRPANGASGGGERLWCRMRCVRGASRGRGCRSLRVLLENVPSLLCTRSQCNQPLLVVVPQLQHRARRHSLSCKASKHVAIELNKQQQTSFVNKLKNFRNTKISLLGARGTTHWRVSGTRQSIAAPRDLIFQFDFSTLNCRLQIRL